MADSTAQLQAALAQMLIPDSAVIRQAEDAVKKLTKDPACVGALLVIIQNSPEPQMRQMASVILRKKIVGHWTRISESEQETVKSVLLDVVTKDPHTLVRKSAANAISAVAKVTVPTGKWNELLNFLYQCSQSPQVEHREVAMQLFSSLTETIGDTLRAHFATLKGIFMAGLADAAPSVRVAALKAVSALVQWVESKTEAALFRDLLTAIVGTVRRSLQEGDEDCAISAFEIFDDCVEMDVAVPIPALLELMLEVAMNKELELNTREKALNFISWVATYKPKVLTKGGIVEPVLHVVLTMCAESDPDGEPDGVVDDDQPTAHKIAAQVVDGLALNLPPKYVFGPVSTWAAQHVRSARWEERRAAIVLLAVIAEGCHELMTEHVSELLPVVYSLIGDPVHKVRSAACVGLVQFCEFLQPDIYEHHVTLIPQLIALLGDAREDVREKACYAIEALCENMEERIGPYLNPLMHILVDIVHSGKTNLKEIAVSAIASLASAAGEDFKPYYAHTMQLLAGLMQLTTPTHMTLRSRATECAGIVAAAVGRDTCGGDVAALMHHVLVGLTLDSNELREYSYGFFSSMGFLLQEDFGEYLGAVMPALLASCQSSDGIVQGGGADGDSDEEADGTGAGGGIPGSSRGIDSDDEHDDKRPSSFSVRTAFLDEKTQACTAIGSLAWSTGPRFGPYVEKSVETVEALANYFHEEVRAAVMGSLHHFVMVVHECSPPPLPPQPDPVPAHTPTSSFSTGSGSVLRAAGPGGPGGRKRRRYWARDKPETWLLSDPTKTLLASVMHTFLQALGDDDDRDVVSRACESIGELVQELGPGAVADHLPTLCQVLCLLLDRKAPCQTYDEDGDDEGDDDVDADGGDMNADEADEDDEEDAEPEGGRGFGKGAGEDEEASEREAALTDAVCECIASLAKTCGASFEPFWRKLFPHVYKYLRPTRSSSDRVMAMGCFAEVCNSLAAASAPYAKQVLQAAMTAVMDADESVKRNAAFCAGVMCQHGGPDAHALYPQVLMALRALFDTHIISDRAVTDNAAGAVARMILTSPQSVPLSQVVPVLLESLPLQSDHEEDSTVYRAVALLLANQEPTVVAHMDRVLAIIGQAAVQKTLAPDARPVLAELLTRAAHTHPEQTRALVHHLPPETLALLNLS